MTFSFPRSQWLKTKVSLKFLLAITWLLEGLSKQSLGFVNSEGYLAIEASRWRLSQTTCYGNAFAVRVVWKYSDPSSLFLLLPPIHTHIFMANMIGAKKEKPFKHSSKTSPLSLSLSPMLTPHHSPQTLPTEQNSWTGRAFLQVQIYHVKRMTHLLKKRGKREKRRLRERKHKQRFFLMMVASGTQRKLEEGKRKIAYNTNSLNDSLKQEARTVLSELECRRMCFVYIL